MTIDKFLSVLNQLEEGLKGPAGKSVELRVSGGYIQWRLVGDTNWINLVATASLQGPKGDKGNDGKAVEVQVSGGYIQWRLVGDASWINLVAISTLKGADGKSLEMQVSGGYLQWRLVGDASWNNLLATGDLKGADGKTLELQVSGGYIQWRREGASTWTNLYAITDLKGADGRAAEFQLAGGYLQWRLVGDASWNNLVAISTLKGADGKAAEFQVADGYIQWRLIGDASWNNLVEVATLQGADGAAVEMQVAGGYIQWRLAGQVAWGNLLALSAIKGADGNRIFFGSTPPVTVEGSQDGDYFLNTNTGEWSTRGLVTSGAWGIIANLHGPAGVDAMPSGGTAGQVLTKLDSTDGNATWLDPVGGGGSALVRSKGTLQGYQVQAVAATSPAPLVVYVSDGAVNNRTGDVNFALTGVGSLAFQFLSTEGQASTNGTGIVLPHTDFDAATAAAMLADAITTAITNAGYASTYAVALSGAYITITSSATGAAQSMTGSSSSAVAIIGGGSGTDAVAASGEVTEVQLIAGVEGKKIKLVGTPLLIQNNTEFDPDRGISVELKDENGGRTALWYSDNGAFGPFYPSFVALDAILNGVSAGESLWAYSDGASSTGSVPILVIAEQY